MDQRARSTTTAANLPHRPEIYFAFMNILIFVTLLSGSGWNAVDCTKKERITHELHCTNI